MRLAGNFMLDDGYGYAQWTVYWVQDEEAEEFDADEAERLANERQMAGDGKKLRDASEPCDHFPQWFVLNCARLSFMSEVHCASCVWLSCFSRYG